VGDGLPLLLNLASTGVMIGIIWFVQVVHYPLFARVGAEGFAAYEAAHSRLTTIVVGPPMLVEAATGLYLVFVPPAGVSQSLLWIGLALIGVIWLTTAFVSVPEHRRLERGWDAAAHRRLVLGNLIRTVAWTLRGIIVLVILAGML
jgi:uncharacterized membrane protein